MANEAEEAWTVYFRVLIIFVAILTPQATALLLRLQDLDSAALMSLQLICIAANVIQTMDWTVGPLLPRSFTT